LSKIFISWSGELSKKLAKELRDWIPAVLQFVKPYFTPADIEKGSQWHSSILSELELSNLGIICLTKENILNPWILFESGALSKNFDKAHVCTILFNLDMTDLTGPLANIQATKFCQDDFKMLIETINNTNENKLDTTVLNNVFNKWWPDLDEKIRKILESVSENKSDNLIKRTDTDILKEILNLSRLNSNKITELEENIVYRGNVLTPNRYIKLENITKKIAYGLRNANFCSDCYQKNEDLMDLIEDFLKLYETLYNRNVSINDVIRMSNTSRSNARIIGSIVNNRGIADQE